MSRPDGSVDEKGVNQNGDPGGHLSVFSNTHTAALRTEIRLLSAFKKDTQAMKVYLAGREYYGEKGKTFELDLVGRIKQQISADPTLHPEYPSSLGLVEFIRQATQVALGRSSRSIAENRVLSVQTPGFNAAVRLGAELLKHWYDVSAAWCGPVYLSVPCDDSLASIFQAAGIQDIRQYYYWDDKQRGICLEKLLEDLERAPEQSVVVLSASAHYPTGADLSQNQWAVVTELIMRRRLLPFFLLPAQALCHGDLERDAWPVQYCASQGIEVLCAQSFSHCFGLYDMEGKASITLCLDVNSEIRGRTVVTSMCVFRPEYIHSFRLKSVMPNQQTVKPGAVLLSQRNTSSQSELSVHWVGLTYKRPEQLSEAVGHLLCVLKHNSFLLSVQSQADKIVRSLWAQPSVGGARVVATVLSNSAHFVEWHGEVKRIVKRCMLIRAVLREKLRLLGTPGCWDHLTQQGGLFCCTGLNGQQVEFLSNCRHVYLLPSGCLNVSAINSRNLEYIAESIRLALTTSF